MGITFTAEKIIFRKLKNKRFHHSLGWGVCVVYVVVIHSSEFFSFSLYQDDPCTLRVVSADLPTLPSFSYFFGEYSTHQFPLDALLLINTL